MVGGDGRPTRRGEAALAWVEEADPGELKESDR